MKKQYTGKTGPFLTKGEVYDVNPYSELLYETTSNQGLSVCVPKEHFTKVPGGDRWIFTVTSGNAIDFCAISRELTYAKPVAFVSWNGREYAIIHESLITKSLYCKGRKKLGMDDDKVAEWHECERGMLAELESLEGRNMIIKWAKNVKAASWKKSHRERGEVEVIQPEID